MRIRSDTLNLLFGSVASWLLLKGRDIISGYWNGPKCICLSFDCDYLEDMEVCGAVIELLQSEEIPASFAIPGHLAKGFPKMTGDLIKAGYEIVNHTFSHPSNFRSMDEDNMRSEIENYQNFMTKTYNYLPRGFRSPHGLRNKSVKLFNILKEKGMYDSSLLGYGLSRVEGVLEIPLSPCPEHPLMAFDTYHHFRFPVSSSSEEKVLKLWMLLLESNNLVNIFMDPLDLLTKPRLELVRQMIKTGKEGGFTFFQMGELTEKYGNSQT